MTDAKSLGFDFCSAKGNTKNSHYSMLHSMKQYINKVIAPHIKHICQDEDLPADQKVIFFIDSYPCSHQCGVLTIHVQDLPKYISYFCPLQLYPSIPACRCWLEPSHKTFSSERMAQLNHHLQMAKGFDPEQVKVTTSLLALCNASVRPLISLFDFMQSSAGYRIIQKVCLNKSYIH